MINDLFERYKLALRRGHVAASQGQLEEAVVAYREAPPRSSMRRATRPMPATSPAKPWTSPNRANDAAPSRAM